MKILGLLLICVLYGCATQNIVYNEGDLQFQKELLRHYEEKSYLYGREAQDLQSHTKAKIYKIERTFKGIP